MEEITPWTEYLVYATLMLLAVKVYFALRGKFTPIKLKGKHVFITGGSSGLGMELAKECYYKGAFVTVLGRDKSKLLTTLKELEFQREHSGLGQYMQVFSVDLLKPEKLSEIVEQAERRFGPVYILFACAGSNQAGFFLETPVQVFKDQMDANYITSVNILSIVARKMCKRKTGRVVLMGSADNYAKLPGKAAWDVSKAAIQALGDSIRPELEQFGVKVHIFNPGPIETPGYIQSNLYKSKFTSLNEGEPITTDEACSILLSGMSAGDYHITTHDWFSFLRVASIGCAPRNSLLLDLILACPSVLGSRLYGLLVKLRMKKVNLQV